MTIFPILFCFKIGSVSDCSQDAVGVRLPSSSSDNVHLTFKRRQGWKSLGAWTKKHWVPRGCHGRRIPWSPGALESSSAPAWELLVTWVRSRQSAEPTGRGPAPVKNSALAFLAHPMHVCGCFVQAYKREKTHRKKLMKKHSPRMKVVGAWEFKLSLFNTPLRWRNA